MECYICYSDHSYNMLQNICKCKGTMGYVHIDCLYQCESGFEICSICHSQITIGIVPKVKQFIISHTKKQIRISAKHSIDVLLNMCCFVLGFFTAVQIGSYKID